MSEQSTKDVQVKGTKRDGVFDEYDHKIHRMGRIGTFVSLITWFLPAIGITLIYKVRLNWGQILAATIAVVSAFGLQGFFQPFTFFPMLGAGGTYLSFIFGNVPQQRLPCATSCQEIMGVDMGTKEGDIVATIAVGISSLVSVAVCTLGMVAVTIIYPVISNPVLSPGFGNIIPALFGYMFVTVFLGSPKVATLPSILCLIMLAVFGLPFASKNSMYLNLFFMGTAVVWAYYLFKKGKIESGGRL